MENATLGSGDFFAVSRQEARAGTSPEGQSGAGARVLREIIRTPAFLEIIRMHARDLDPEDARELVRTFLWEDVELSLSTVGSISEVVNYLAAAVLELGRQMNNFPGTLLEQYVSQAVSEIDTDVLRQYPEVFGPLLENLRAGENAALATGAAVNAVAGFVNRAAAANQHFVKDALACVDGREVARAAFAVLRSGALWLFSVIKGLLVRQ